MTSYVHLQAVKLKTLAITLQPNAVNFNGCKEGLPNSIDWVGTESGHAPYPLWYAMDGCGTGMWLRVRYVCTVCAYRTRIPYTLNPLPVRCAMHVRRASCRACLYFTLPRQSVCLMTGRGVCILYTTLVHVHVHVLEMRRVCTVYPLVPVRYAAQSPCMIYLTERD